MLSNQEIQKKIYHRYPFLLVDKLVELEAGKKAIGIKNVTINEPFFQGHFPDFPIMPGVLIVEALAQVGAAAMSCDETYEGKLALLVGINDVRFKRQVVPGDVLKLEVEIVSVRRNIGTGKVLATVDGKVACKGEIMFGFVDC